MLNPHEQLLAKARDSYSNAALTTNNKQYVQNPKSVPPQKQNLICSIAKHLGTIIVLCAITLLVMYWPTIWNEASFWYRQRNNPPAPNSEQINALYPGEKAWFELKEQTTPVAPVIPPDNRIVIDKIEVNARLF